MKCVRRLRGEAGESLAELLVAIAILGIAIVAIVGGLGNALLASNVHRNHATAGAVARNAAESLKDRKLAWNSNGSYSVSTSEPGFTVSVSSSQCWTGDAPATFSACPTSFGLQQLTVTASGNGATESVVVLKRKT